MYTHCPNFNWATFLSQSFSKVRNFEQDSCGVTVKNYCDSESSFQRLLVVDSVDPNAMPDVIPPKGLDFKRKRYLYHEIREFVSEDKQDIVCPSPGPIPEESDDSSSDDSNLENRSEITSPPRKRGRGRGRGCTRGRGHLRGFEE